MGILYVSTRSSANKKEFYRDVIDFYPKYPRVLWSLLTLKVINDVGTYNGYNKIVAGATLVFGPKIKFWEFTRANIIEFFTLEGKSWERFYLTKTTNDLYERNHRASNTSFLN